MQTDVDRAWRLLFDIALSHGESLAQQHLTFAGLDAFLHSADLIGPKTGVYPLLIERLWTEHSRPWCPSAAVALRRDYACPGKVSRSAPPRAGDEESAPEVPLVVGLIGFTDIMKIVSVRCYQVNKLFRLYDEKEDARMDLKKAIALACEDHVRMEKSVAYTAGEYLKGFIYRSTIHASSIVTLDPEQRAWVPHADRLIRHVVESLRASVILPLFEAYCGPDGAACMSREGFVRFVEDVFPDFTATQRAAACAIFGYDGLLDLQSLFVRASVPLMGPGASEEPVLVQTAPATTAAPAGTTASGECMASTTSVSLPFCSTGSDARNGPAGAPPSAAAKAGPLPRMIGLDGFVDALLLLCVVLYADEHAYPHHRPVTAKVWSGFVDHFCPAARERLPKPTAAFRASARQSLHDPLFCSLPNGPSVTPTLTLVAPEQVPICHVSSVLLNGLAVAVDPEWCLSEDSAAARYLGGGSSGAEGEEDKEHQQQQQQQQQGMPVLPPRLMRPPESSHGTEVQAAPTGSDGGGSGSFSNLYKDDTDSAGDEATFITSAPAEPAEPTVEPWMDWTPGEGGRGRGKSAAQAAAEKHVADQAAMLYTGVFASDGTAPLPLVTTCRVCVEDEPVWCVRQGPSHVEALLPSCLWQALARHMRLQVHVHMRASPAAATAAAGADGGLRIEVEYTPIRRVPLSLRDTATDRVFSSKEITVFLDGSVQVLPADICARLQAVFAEGVAAAGAAGAAENPEGAPDRLPFESLTAVATGAHLVRPSTATAAVEAAAQLSLCNGGPLSFSDFVSLVAMLPCTPHLGGSVFEPPQLISYLRTAFVQCAEEEAAAAKAAAAAAAPASAAFPYSIPLEAPFKASVRSKTCADAEGAARKEQLFQELREAQQELLQVTGAPRHKGRYMPAFPAQVAANPLYLRRFEPVRDAATPCPIEDDLIGVVQKQSRAFIAEQILLPHPPPSLDL